MPVGLVTARGTALVGKLASGGPGERGGRRLAPVDMLPGMPRGSSATARLRSKWASLLLLGLGPLAGPGVAGCGPTLYASRISQARAELLLARQLGAERAAPYEFHYAREHLDAAGREALEADYGSAAELAEAAYHYAGQAIQIARRATTGGGATPNR